MADRYVLLLGFPGDELVEKTSVAVELERAHRNAGPHEVRTRSPTVARAEACSATAQRFRSELSAAEGLRPGDRPSVDLEDDV